MLCLVLCVLYIEGQTLTQVTGLVRDSLTREPVSFATVTLKGTTEGTVTNDKGGFAINTRARSSKLRVSALGYRAVEVPVRAGQGSIVIVELVPEAVDLDEVVVHRKKEKYSKKDNPAVEFVKRLRAHRADNAPLRRHNYHWFKQYERVVYGMNDVSETDNNLLIKKFPFLNDFADTSEVTGRRVLPVSVREKVSWQYYSRAGGKHRERVVGLSNEGIDEHFDQASVKRFLDEVFREVDIFQNDVTILSNRFVSPLSAIGPDFYKYYLSDTVSVDGELCAELSFAPFTPETFGFIGRIYVPLADTTAFVKRVTMNVPQRINLNYVERVSIRQDYDRAPDGTRLLMRDNMEVEFRVVKGSTGLFARRLTSCSEHHLQAPDDLSMFDHSFEQEVEPEAYSRPPEFWVDQRSESVGSDGHSVKNMLTRLRQSRAYYWGEKAVVALATGYVGTSAKSKWDFGPLNTTISGNALEGVRLRLGGMTTVNLNRHLFARGYVAYGTRDGRVKYMGQLEYSFTAKQHLAMEFPIHSLRLMHRYDVERLGQNYLHTNADNVFLALKRRRDNLLAYRRDTELEYLRESPSHFSFSFAFTHLVHESSRFIAFESADAGSCRRYTEAGFRVTLRYAPGEKFFQTRTRRIPINSDAPVVTLSHTYMPRGFLGSMFTVNKTEVRAQKRFWFSAFGYADVLLNGAKIWSRVAYPDLLLPNANLSYTIQNESYALMNAMEFATDQYLAWDLTYWGNGVLMNRLPLIKRLKLREVLTFRGIWGGLSDKNNPAMNPDLFAFPAGTGCTPLGSTPYMEASVGLDNIFTFLRVDYVWRLTYRNRPGIDRGGVRIRLHFNF